MVEYCLKLGKPLVIFINGMDKPNADYAGTVAALEIVKAGQIQKVDFYAFPNKIGNGGINGNFLCLFKKYAGKLAPIQLPVMADGKMTGYVNAIQEKAYKFWYRLWKAFLLRNIYPKEFRRFPRRFP